MEKPAAAARMPREGLFIVVLAVLGGLTPLSVDMYLPAMPTLAAAFDTTAGAVQQTLSAFMLGYAAGMLLWGPVGDRFGRRGPMIVGLAVYVLASIGCATAPDIQAVIALRALQALGGCAAAALSQAAVADVYDRKDSARAFSLIIAVSLAAPMAAPLLGGLLLTALGWRSVFWTLAIFGAACIAGVAMLPETLPPERRLRVSATALLTGYLRIAADRRFMAYVLSGGLVYAGMFAYIAATPFIYIQLFKVPARAYGLLFALNVVGMMAMNFASSRLVGPLGPDRLLRIGVSIAAAMGVILLITGHAGFTGPLGLLALAAPVFGYVAAIGLIGGNSAAGALAEFRDRAGAASALMGGINMALGAAAAAAVGLLGDGTAGPMTLVMFGVSLLALAVNRLGLRPRV